MADVDDLGRRLEHVLDNGDVTIGIAESLTGGALSATVARIRGSGAWYRGAVVAYSRDVKHDLLAVPPGPVVSAEAASMMAERVADRLDATLTLAVTGVAGPDAQDGQPPGTVWMAVHAPARTDTRLLRISGEPDEVIEQTCVEGLRWLVDVAEELVRG